MDPLHLSKEELDYELSIRSVFNLSTQRVKSSKLKELLIRENSGLEMAPANATSFSSANNEIDICAGIYNEIIGPNGVNYSNLEDLERAKSRLIHLRGRLGRISTVDRTGIEHIAGMLRCTTDALNHVERTIDATPFPLNFRPNQSVNGNSSTLFPQTSVPNELPFSNQTGSPPVGIQNPLESVNRDNTNTSLVEEIFDGAMSLPQDRISQLGVDRSHQRTETHDLLSGQIRGKQSLTHPAIGQIPVEKRNARYRLSQPDRNSHQITDLWDDPEVEALTQNKETRSAKTFQESGSGGSRQHPVDVRPGLAEFEVQNRQSGAGAIPKINNLTNSSLSVEAPIFNPSGSEPNRRESEKLPSSHSQNRFSQPNNQANISLTREVRGQVPEHSALLNNLRSENPLSKNRGSFSEINRHNRIQHQYAQNDVGMPRNREDEPNVNLTRDYGEHRNLIYTDLRQQQDCPKTHDHRNFANEQNEKRDNRYYAEYADTDARQQPPRFPRCYNYSQHFDRRTRDPIGYQYQLRDWSPGRYFGNAANLGTEQFNCRNLDDREVEERAENELQQQRTRSPPRNFDRTAAYTPYRDEDGRRMNHSDRHAPRFPFAAYNPMLPRNVHPREDQADPNFDNVRPRRIEIPRKTVPVHQWRISFCGEGKGLHLFDFLDQISLYQRSENISNNELLSSIVHLLTGRAKLWYRSAYDSIFTWDEFVSALKTEFLPRNYEYMLLADISSRVQRPNETFAEFITHMKSLFKCLTIPIDEDYKIFLVQKNLLPKYAVGVAPLNIQSLEQLSNVCRRIDGAYNRSNTIRMPFQEFQRSYDRPFARNSDRNRELMAVEHSEEANDDSSLVDIDERELLEVRKPRSGTSVRRDKRVVNDNQSVKRKINCWNCKKDGHGFKECNLDQDGKFCYKCGLEDTLFRDCSRCHPGNATRNLGRTGSAQDSEASSPQA